MDRELILNKFSKEKRINLIICIMLDTFGYFTYLIPFFGEFLDFFFAPASGIVLTAIFWKYGKLQSMGAGLINFCEEVFLFADFVPSATLMWLYLFVKNENKSFKKWYELREEKFREMDSGYNYPE